MKFTSSFLGLGTFHTNESSYPVAAKDVVVMPEGMAHHIETNSLEYITVTRPDWYEGQYRQVE